MTSKTMDELLNRIRCSVPGFYNDRDEDWMIYLTPHKKVRLRELRALFIEAYEIIRTETSQLKMALDQNKKDHAKKKELRRAHKERDKKYQAELRDLVTEILPEVESLKEEGLRLRNQKYQRESEELRRQIIRNREDPTIDISDDIELVADDYLPCYIPDTKRPRVAPRERSPEPEPEPEQPAPEQTIEDEDVIENLDPNSINGKILRQLKSLVVKYNCYEKVIKAIEIHSARKSARDCLEVIRQMQSVNSRNRSR